MINALETKRIVTALIVVAMIFGAMFAFTTVKAYALTEAQIQSILSLLSSFGSDQATIDNVNASLRGQATSGTTGTTGFTFTKSLSKGDSNAEVKELQKFLNSDSDTQVASSGVGSAGNETEYFGSLTKAAVIKFQNKYASDVLAPVGLTSGTGYWGSSSRAKANSMGGGTSTTGGTTTTAPTGTGLTVASATQPAASLAPDSAARVPFTNFTVTAGSDGDVTMDSVVIKRVGLAANASFAGVVLLDENGVMLGTAKTLNSNDQATIGESVTIPAGTSKTFTVGGNMASDNSARAGQVAGLSVIAVNTSAAVNGSLPIAGVQHTINSTLTIGSAAMSVSSFDPNSNQSKSIGTTGVRVAGVQVTAGSAEDIRIRNIRWNQTGSAGKTDITNVVTVVDGTEYPTTLSADGKYYTANFGSGVVVSKGNNADVYVKVDIISGSARTVIMDIDKATDIYITGETFGYGITATQSQNGTAASTDSVFTSGTPFFDNATMTISAGTVTTIQKSASIASQNIAVNVPNQPLGAFETNIKGEAINISGMTITVATSAAFTTGGALTNVSIVDQNGTVVAGPIDGSGSNSLTLAFTDSMTIPTGKMVYTVKGKVGSNATNGGTYTLTVTPTGWTSPTGDVTGDAITISTVAFTLNVMTVRSSALDITISSSPVAQNITAGVQGFTFANVQLDATQSGEDVRFSAIPLSMTFSTLTVDQVTACQLFDGSNALNTGGNVVNPTASSDVNTTFTFDNSLTVTKGKVKTLALKCNLSSAVSADDTLSWGINASPSITVTGVTSSNSVGESVTAATGSTMTVKAVTLAVSKDSSSPSYTIAAAGSTGVIDGVIKFRAANEAVTLQRVGLTLSSPASNGSKDLVQVSLWDGSMKVGTAVFTGTNNNATSTLTTPVTLPKDTDKLLTVKVDLANIGSSQTGVQGDKIIIDIDVNGTNTQGVGQQSGVTIGTASNAITGSTSMNGIRMFKSYPTFAKLAIPSTTLVTSTMDLYRFSVTANSAGPIGIFEFTVNIATSSTPSGTSSTTVTNLKVYAYTDSGFSTTVSGFSTAGQLNTTDPTLVSSGTTTVLMSGVSSGDAYLQIPAGSTYYFRVVADVALTGGPTGGSITTNVQGDDSYGTLALPGGVNPYDFVWSPNATTTSSVNHVDWTNGYFVPGLPSDNMSNQVIVK